MCTVVDMQPVRVTVRYPLSRTQRWERHRSPVACESVSGNWSARTGCCGKRMRPIVEGPVKALLYW